MRHANPPSSDDQLRRCVGWMLLIGLTALLVPGLPNWIIMWGGSFLILSAAAVVLIFQQLT